MANLNLSLEDLVIAYRKAKVDAFYESGHNTAISFAEYETNLLKNLKNLQSKLNSGSDEWVQQASFVGTYALLLKSVQHEIKSRTVYFSDSKKQWSKGEKASVDFRIIGQHSIDFHILSSLWIDKVGYRIETKVSEKCYGCRLKRPGQTWDSFVNDENRNSSPKKLQLGHFRSYITDYKKWQKKGIKAIRYSLRKEPRVIVTTFDLRKFYHRIDPSFLLDNYFVKKILETKYTDDERLLTDLLIKAIYFWSKQILADSSVPSKFKVNQHCGVPLGLGASKVIANLILMGVDNEIEKKLKPIYYGRYVDDFFIVLKDKKGVINTSEDLWTYFSTKLSGLVDLNKSLNSKSDTYNYELQYATNSNLEFGRDKEKVFILEGNSGEALIDKILKDLDENSSEWKMLPDAEDNLDELTESIVNSTSNESDEAPSLRNADKVSIQRLKFSLRLRDFETMVGLAPVGLWKNGLEKFFKLSLVYILAADNIPVYNKYYPRIVRLAIKSGNHKAFESIWNQHQASWSFLKKIAKHEEDLKLLDKGYMFSNKLLHEAILTSFPLDRKVDVSKWKKLFIRLRIESKNITADSEKLFFADLHSVPFKKVFLDSSLILPKAWGSNTFSLNTFVGEIENSILKLNIRREFIKKVVGDKLSIYAKYKQDFVPNALFFFTRPHSMLEVTYLIPDWCTEFSISQMNAILSIFGLPDIPSHPIKLKTEPKAFQMIEISMPTVSDEVRNPSFALTSLETKIKSWEAVVLDNPIEPDVSRYVRIFGLVNEILKRKEVINYVVFPELSIPRHILLYLAQKLKTKNISLIAGVEYEKRSSAGSTVLNLFSNQLFIILNTKTSGRYEQLAIVQEKVEAAIHEKSELKKIGKKRLVPRNQFKFLINHGGFNFSGLICNDFLNISYRDSLRGLIDALVVVEWNPDTETYDSLVQASGNDLHCFVMQVNNRIYGDTRLRAPYKEAYMRDQVRIRGGEFDYFVLATLDVEGIRKFQRKKTSPKKPFKPTPTGYRMSKGRKFGK